MATTSPFIIATKKLLARNGSNIGSKSGAGKCTWNLDGMTVRGMSTLKGSSPEQRRNVHHNLAFNSDPAPKRLNIMENLVSDIHHSLKRSDALLNEMSMYYFNGEGKFIRPRLTGTMAGAVNCHLGIEGDAELERKQRIISMVSEMWHTSSLVHDDVIDHAESRRGYQSVNDKWGAKRSIFTGDYVLAVSVKLLADTQNPKVIETMSQILSDLVNGEFQQMSNREDDEDRFQLYLDKTFNKTASLMAYSCKSVAELAVPETRPPSPIPHWAFKYGENIGLAFQLIDDWLDFVASADQLGKPAGADLKLGLATAPVLFAKKEFPELADLINRNFKIEGDVEKAFETVLKSSGLAETKRFAKEYATKAISDIKDLRESSYKDELRRLAESTVERCS